MPQPTRGDDQAALPARRSGGVPGVLQRGGAAPPHRRLRAAHPPHAIVEGASSRQCSRAAKPKEASGRSRPQRMSCRWEWSSEAGVCMIPRWRAQLVLIRADWLLVLPNPVAAQRPCSEFLEGGCQSISKSLLCCQRWTACPDCRSHIFGNCGALSLRGRNCMKTGAIIDVGTRPPDIPHCRALTGELVASENLRRPIDSDIAMVRHVCAIALWGASNCTRRIRIGARRPDCVRVLATMLFFADQVSPLQSPAQGEHTWAPEWRCPSQGWRGAHQHARPQCGTPRDEK